MSAIRWVLVVVALAMLGVFVAAQVADAEPGPVRVEWAPIDVPNGSNKDEAFTGCATFDGQPYRLFWARSEDHGQDDGGQGIGVGFSAVPAPECGR